MACARPADRPDRHAPAPAGRRSLPRPRIPHLRRRSVLARRWRPRASSPARSPEPSPRGARRWTTWRSSRCSPGWFADVRIVAFGVRPYAEQEEPGRGTVHICRQAVHEGYDPTWIAAHELSHPRSRRQEAWAPLQPDVREHRRHLVPQHPAGRGRTERRGGHVRHTSAGRRGRVTPGHGRAGPGTRRPAPHVPGRPRPRARGGAGQTSRSDSMRLSWWRAIARFARSLSSAT